jgi:hypothetical protein
VRNCTYTPKALAWAKARPGQAGVLALGLAHNFLKPRPPKARPKPGLSGQARAGTSLTRTPTGLASNAITPRKDASETEETSAQKLGTREDREKKTCESYTS